MKIIDKTKPDPYSVQIGTMWLNSVGMVERRQHGLPGHTSPIRARIARAVPQMYTW